MTFFFVKNYSWSELFIEKQFKYNSLQNNSKHICLSLCYDWNNESEDWRTSFRALFFDNFSTSLHMYDNRWRLLFHKWLSEGGESTKKYIQVSALTQKGWLFEFFFQLCYSYFVSQYSLMLLRLVLLSMNKFKASTISQLRNIHLFL